MSLPLAYRLDENKTPQPLTQDEILSGELEKVLADWNSKIVRQTHIRNYFISTVFLAVDHGCTFYNEETYVPILFETMIKKDEVFMDYQERYQTWKEAQQGHRDAVRMVIKEIRNAAK